MMVQVPAGAAPGQVLQVQLPPSSSTNAVQQHQAPAHQPLRPPSSHTIPGGMVTVGGHQFAMPGLPHRLNTMSHAANLHAMEEYWFDRTCKKVKIGLAWDAGCDVDSSVAMLDRNMTIVDTVSYKQLQSRCRSVKHSGDDTTGKGGGDDETIKVKLRDIPQRVTHLLFVVSVFSAGRSFAHVRRCSVRAVLDKKHQSFKPVLFKYPLSQSHAAHCNA